MLYEFKLKVTKTMDDGTEREVKEHYICDAVLHGEAEAKGYALYEGHGEVDVISVGRSDVQAIVDSPAEGKFCYKAVAVETTVDDFGKEKENRYPILVFADSFPEAMQKAEKRMREFDASLDSLRRIKILDYLKD